MVGSPRPAGAAPGRRVSRRISARVSTDAGGQPGDAPGPPLMHPPSACARTRADPRRRRRRSPRVPVRGARRGDIACVRGSSGLAQVSGSAPPAKICTNLARGTPRQKVTLVPLLMSLLQRGQHSDGADRVDTADDPRRCARPKAHVGVLGGSSNHMGGGNACSGGAAAAETCRNRACPRRRTSADKSATWVIVHLDDPGALRARERRRRGCVRPAVDQAAYIIVGYKDVEQGPKCRLAKPA